MRLSLLALVAAAAFGASAQTAAACEPFGCYDYAVGDDLYPPGDPVLPPAIHVGEGGLMLLFCLKSTRFGFGYSSSVDIDVGEGGLVLLFCIKCASFSFLVLLYPTLHGRQKLATQAAVLAWH